MGGKSVAGKHGTARSGKRVPDEQAAVVLMLRLETLFLDWNLSSPISLSDKIGVFLSCTFP
jgi:hypothetical protein